MSISAIFSFCASILAFVAPIVFLYRKRGTVKSLAVGAFRAWKDTFTLLRERVGCTLDLVAHPDPKSFEAVLGDGLKKQESRMQEATSLTLRLVLYLVLPFVFAQLACTMLFFI